MPPPMIAISIARLLDHPLLSSTSPGKRTSTMSEKSLRCGMLIFPNLTQLDLTGPSEILARLPGGQAPPLFKTADPVPSAHRLTILPTAPFANSRPLAPLLAPPPAAPPPLPAD